MENRLLRKVLVQSFRDNRILSLNRNNISDSVWGCSDPASMHMYRLYQAHYPMRHMRILPERFRRRCVSALHRSADSLRECFHNIL